MPNWCSNDLTIEGNEETISKIVDKHFRLGQFDILRIDFDSVIPYPEECRDADRQAAEESGIKDAYSQQGFKWAVDRWGTKWNVSEDMATHSVREDGEVFASFETAWSPPEPVALELSRLYPDVLVSLKYKEEGMGFEGEYVCQGGEVKIDNSWDV